MKTLCGFIFPLLENTMRFYIFTNLYYVYACYHILPFEMLVYSMGSCMGGVRPKFFPKNIGTINIFSVFGLSCIGGGPAKNFF